MEKLAGEWKYGVALDLHTISSTKDQFGNFINQYTQIGEILHDIKYGNFSIEQKKNMGLQLAQIATNFIKKLLVFPYLNVIIPVPYSKEREFQPLYYITYMISKLTNIPADFNYINKTRHVKELKSIASLEDRKKELENIFKVDLRYKNKKVLLFDDLYRSGATLNEITNTLYKHGKVDNVYVVTLTKTRKNK
ncbi:ComF family protein [Campylobacter armoricus]|uniref:Putative ComF family competence protein n=1 Tax=Campylobacter armoricus TaxID=2505970 RepID=A0A7L5HTU1_9BACT|nr:ComF family protein [Campylobacter armoricus]QKF80434.1 putative ComF family competence protein [Campylobacter armoricus]